LEIIVFLDFRTLSILSTALAAALFLTLLFMPELVFWLFQIPDSESAAFLSRRAAVLFLGYGVLMWLVRNAENSSVRRAICMGWGTAMTALAVLGTIEFIRGFVGPGIFSAVAIETFVGVSYLRLARNMN